MNAIHSHTNPPRWMQAVVSALLPPIYREPVLGDLEERFGERRPGARWLGYAGDVVTTVPQVLASQMRPSQMRARALGAAHGDLRTRAETHQTGVWMRNAAGVVSIVLVAGSCLLNARGGWHYPELVSLALTLGWIGAVWQSWAQGRSRPVPAALSFDELRAFHRGELIRQRDLSVRGYVYWFVPAVLLVLYALTGAVPSVRRPVVTLVAIGMQTCVIVWAYRKARHGFQRELDRLEQEVEEPV